MHIALTLSLVLRVHMPSICHVHWYNCSGALVEILGLLGTGVDDDDCEHVQNGAGWTQETHIPSEVSEGGSFYHGIQMTKVTIPTCDIRRR